jgi:hypothetical protein
VVTAFERDQNKWITVSAEAGQGCGVFRGEGWALFESNAGALDLASKEPFHRSFFSPVSAFDAEGDGSPEFLGSDLRVLQRRNGRYEIVLDASPPDFECGC